MTVTEEQKSNLREFLRECVREYLTENQSTILERLDVDDIIDYHIESFRMYQLPEEADYLVEKSQVYTSLKARVYWLENRQLELESRLTKIEEKLNNEEKMRFQGKVMV